MNVYGVELIPEGDRVVINATRDGHFEPESVIAWKAAIFPGALAFDVGAYTGLYAIMAAQGGARVTAYEPNPTVFHRLNQNIALNCVQVKCIPRAASDKRETRELWMKHGMTSAGRFNERVGAKSVMVECEPLHSETEVHAIKIDVEGAEMAVLRGAENILDAYKPMIIAEALTPAKANRLIEHMARFNYRFNIADKRNLIFRKG